MFHIIHNFRYPLGKHIRHPLKSFKCSPSFAYKFCSEKKNDRDENIDELINEKQKELIKKHTVDERWNEVLGIQKNYNFQKQLIVSKKKYERSTKQLREAILFEDLLKNQLNILIYDTQGKPFYRQLLITILTLVGIGIIHSILMLQKQNNPKIKLLLQIEEEGVSAMTSFYIMYAIFIITRIKRHGGIGKRYVQKIVYNTEKEEFNITRRNLFGMRRQLNMSRYKMVYTQNSYLTKKGTNYFDLDTKRQFSIIYKNAWVKQDLFSHLIAQRIQI